MGIQPCQRIAKSYGTYQDDRVKGSTFRRIGTEVRAIGNLTPPTYVIASKTADSRKVL